MATRKKVTNVVSKTKKNHIVYKKDRYTDSGRIKVATFYFLGDAYIAVRALNGAELTNKYFLE